MPNYHEWQTNDILQRELGEARKRLQLLSTIITYAVGVLMVGCVLFAYAAGAHDVMPGMTSEEKAVAEFYAGWMQPMGPEMKERMYGCCNKTDCSKVLEWKQRGDGTWTVRTELAPTSFYPVRQEIMEDVQPDPRESPDGNSHACIIQGIVKCAVRGAGT